MKTSDWSLFPPQHKTTDKRHGRLEIRQVWTSTDLNHYLEFPFVGQVFCVHRKFIHLKSQKTTEETRYGITSLTPHKADPSRILQLNRGHWSMENSLHDVRDVTFREDHSAIRTNHAPRVMATLRNCIISIFRFLGKTAIAQTLRTMTYKPHLALKLLRL
ncbi:MAG: ISAs1 family transposase [Candidatus Brocadia sp.]|nr:ISAs1 family transposase [Candidatus Brocadia sp.]